MRGTERRIDDPELRQLEELWNAPARAPRHPAARRRWRWALLAAWVATMASIFIMESLWLPASEEAVPMWAQLLAIGFSTALMLTLAGLFTGRPWGFGTSGAAALLGLGIAAACSLSEHHPAALWGFEFAMFAGLAGLTYAASRRI